MRIRFDAVVVGDLSEGRKGTGQRVRAYRDAMPPTHIYPCFSKYLGSGFCLMICVLNSDLWQL